MNNKVRVAYFPPNDKSWMGGVNYYLNLLESLKLVPNSNIKPIIFIGKKADYDIKRSYLDVADVVESSIFDRKSLFWYIHKIQLRFFGQSFFLNHLVKKNKISVLSHSEYVSVPGCKSITWIPDFQHFCLPEMFSKKELVARDRVFSSLLEKSDVVLLSSYSALKDLHNYSGTNSKKARVLHFVSRPAPSYWKLNSSDEIRLREKYNIKGEYFYLPNQFWKHKNHITLFKAIKELKLMGIEVCLVCSGEMSDYRNKTYIDSLLNYIDVNELNRNVIFLNLIPYGDVFGLIKFSKCVINPSLFEGWSSTVEECKSVLKPMILSDIDVHKEQYPEALFFDKENHLDLAEKIKMINVENTKTVQMISNDQALRQFEIRFKSFAKKYIDIVNKL